VKFLVAFLAISLGMALLWKVAERRTQRALADLGWTIGVGILALTWSTLGEGDLWRRVLLAAMGLIWCVRLAVHLWRDRLKSGKEDGRYIAISQNWGEHASRRYFIFFQAQGLLSFLLSFSFYAAATNTTPFPNYLDLMALSWWIACILCESLADRQLARFRATPANRGRTCRDGLWRYSRHPNYFFEWLQWMTFFFLAWYTPLWWIPLLVSMVLLGLIFGVTGIPPTEAQAILSRGEDYRAYQRTTSRFIPWFPKKESI
jgi:steroid 5-alpha reductase family enzyme